MFYSVTTGGFYAKELRPDYLKNGTWPDDAIEISHGDELKIREARGRSKQVRYNNGAWSFVDTPVDEAVAAAAVRAQRDALLASCDYLAMPDYPISDSDSASLRAYRKDLRDVTLQQGFPSDVVWPTFTQDTGARASVMATGDDAPQRPK